MKSARSSWPSSTESSPDKNTTNSDTSSPEWESQNSSQRSSENGRALPPLKKKNSIKPTLPKNISPKKNKTILSPLQIKTKSHQVPENPEKRASCPNQKVEPNKEFQQKLHPRDKWERSFSPRLRKKREKSHSLQISPETGLRKISKSVSQIQSRSEARSERKRGSQSNLDNPRLNTWSFSSFISTSFQKSIQDGQPTKSPQSLSYFGRKSKSLIKLQSEAN